MESSVPNAQTHGYQNASHDPYLGVTVDGAVIERKLGQGGMGSVYQARHLNLDKYIAIKILPPEFSQNPQNIERFVREARSAAKLEHPNIVQVYNAGSQNSIHFISMQFVAGESLEAHIEQKKKIPFLNALWIMKASIDGLAFAHQNGIIHRDIKPENIMITANGEVKVVDFGLARSTEAGGTLSATGQIMGTPYFMSPEQCNGELADERSDIYSLGITFYYMLSGERPYEGGTAVSILMQHANEQPSKVLNPDLQLPNELVLLIQKMMNKNKEERYQELREVLKDLELLLANYSPEPLYSKEPLPPAPLPAVTPPTSATLVDHSASKMQRAAASTSRMNYPASGVTQATVTYDRKAAVASDLHQQYPQHHGIESQNGMQHYNTPHPGVYGTTNQMVYPVQKKFPLRAILACIIFLMVAILGIQFAQKQSKARAYQKQVTWTENQVTLLKEEKTIDFIGIRQLYENLEQQYPQSRNYCQQRLQKLIKEESEYQVTFLLSKEEKIRALNSKGFSQMRDLYIAINGTYPADANWCEKQVLRLYKEEADLLLVNKDYAELAALMFEPFRRSYPDLYEEYLDSLEKGCLEYYKSLHTALNAKVSLLKQLNGNEKELILLHKNLCELKEERYSQVLFRSRDLVFFVLEDLAKEGNEGFSNFIENFALASQIRDSQLKSLLANLWNNNIVEPFPKLLEERVKTPEGFKTLNTACKTLKAFTYENSYYKVYVDSLENSLVKRIKSEERKEKRALKKRLSKTLFRTTFPKAWQAFSESSNKVTRRDPDKRPPYNPGKNPDGKKPRKEHKKNRGLTKLINKINNLRERVEEAKTKRGGFRELGALMPKAHQLKMEIESALQSGLSREEEGLLMTAVHKLQNILPAPPDGNGPPDRGPKKNGNKPPRKGGGFQDRDH